jgi:hypothetical protein
MGSAIMTTGELFASHSSAPSGSPAIYHLEALCQEGGCGEFGLIPITDIDCDLLQPQLDGGIRIDTYNGDLLQPQLNGIISTEVLSADLITDNINGAITCQ